MRKGDLCTHLISCLFPIKYRVYLHESSQMVVCACHFFLGREVKLRTLPPSNILINAIMPSPLCQYCHHQSQCPNHDRGVNSRHTYLRYTCPHRTPGRQNVAPKCTAAGDRVKPGKRQVCEYMYKHGSTVRNKQ